MATNAVHALIPHAAHSDASSGHTPTLDLSLRFYYNAVISSWNSKDLSDLNWAAALPEPA
jgi:hypothetical protein